MFKIDFSSWDWSYFVENYLLITAIVLFFAFLGIRKIIQKTKTKKKEEFNMEPQYIKVALEARQRELNDFLRNIQDKEYEAQQKVRDEYQEQKNAAESELRQIQLEKQKL